MKAILLLLLRLLVSVGSKHFTAALKYVYEASQLPVSNADRAAKVKADLKAEFGGMEGYVANVLKELATAYLVKEKKITLD